MTKVILSSEWLAKRYPEFDLKERGKDWRKCMSVMNSTARYLRLMAKKQRVGGITRITRTGNMKTQPYKLVADVYFLIHQQLKIQREGETMEPPTIQNSYTEPVHEPDSESDPEMEQPTEKDSAGIEEPIENYTAEMGRPIEEYTAEIDVELSDSEEEEDASIKKRTQKEEEESSPTSCSDIVYGNFRSVLKHILCPCMSNADTAILWFCR